MGINPTMPPDHCPPGWENDAVLSGFLTVMDELRDQAETIYAAFPGAPRGPPEWRLSAAYSCFLLKADVLLGQIVEADIDFVHKMALLMLVLRSRRLPVDAAVMLNMSALSQAFIDAQGFSSPRVLIHQVQQVLGYPV